MPEKQSPARGNPGYTPERRPALKKKWYRRYYSKEIDILAIVAHHDDVGKDLQNDIIP